MAQRKRNHASQLEEALATLINSQATLAANQASFLAHFLAQTARTDERFSRIESELTEIKAILLRHEHMLQALPDAVRQKVGFETR
jgi:hypothetical protein